jgi:hypothetical protein
LQALYSLALAELKTVATSCEQIKLKAMRGAAATKVSSLITKVRVRLGGRSEGAWV